MATKVARILAARRTGRDCTWEESAELKHYVRHHPDPRKDRTTAQIADLFIAEFSEALDELEKYGPDLDR